MNEKMESSVKNKTTRKVQRASKKIEKDFEQAIFVNYPTKVLCACNVGHVSCANYEDFLDAFMPFGDLDDVVLVPNKAYSFVFFTDISAASRAYEALNGQIVSSLSQTVYLSYVKSVPESVKRTNWKLCTQNLPEGLTVVKDFVSEEEEANIIKGIGNVESFVYYPSFLN